jgi:hypothetical protein
MLFEDIKVNIKVVFLVDKNSVVLTWNEFKEDFLTSFHFKS